MWCERGNTMEKMPPTTIKEDERGFQPQPVIVSAAPL
jgi:hypothetical protein